MPKPQPTSARKPPAGCGLFAWLPRQALVGHRQSQFPEWVHVPVGLVVCAGVFLPGTYPREWMVLLSEGPPPSTRPPGPNRDSALLNWRCLPNTQGSTCQQVACGIKTHPSPSSHAHHPVWHQREDGVCFLFFPVGTQFLTS